MAGEFGAARSAPRIRVSGSVSLNGGDAAILEAELAMLRAVAPDAEVHVADSKHVAAATYLPGIRFVPPLVWVLGGRRPAVERRRELQQRELQARVMRPSVRARLVELQASDVVLYTGGTSLVPHYPVAPKLLELEAAQRAGIPVVLLPQSLGPFTEPAQRERVGRVLAASRLVMLRDDQSYAHALELGSAPERTLRTPDIVFALAEPRQVLHERQHPEHPRRVAVSVRDWSHFASGDAAAGMQAYRQGVADLVTHLVREHGTQVTFLSTCQGRPQYHFDDAAAAREVVALLPSDVTPSVVVDDSHHSTPDLMAAYRTFDLLVATRLHAAILALCVGTPVLPIAYEFKTTEVFDELGFREHVTAIEDVTGPRLVSAYEALCAQLPARRGELVDAVSAMRERTELISAGLRDVLG